MSDEVPKIEPEVWPRVVKLAHPVVFGSETISQLTFRRGRFGDLKGLKVDDVPPASDLMTIAARMCGQPREVIEQLDGDDVSEALEIVLGFLDRCLVGGTKR